MSQVDIGTSIGYAMKRTTASLRAAMDERLRELGLTVPQYSSLELLAHSPGISNADLARGVFVSRQATHQLLAGLKRLQLVEIDGTGRDQRLRLTPKGTRTLHDASAAVAQTEERMLSGLDATERRALRRALDSCAEALA